MVPMGDPEWMCRAETSRAASGAAPSDSATVVSSPDLSWSAAAFTCSLAATSFAAVAVKDTDVCGFGEPPVSTTVTSAPALAADRK